MSATLHELKTWPLYFKAVRDGRKTFEVRKEDRGFRPGDYLRLREWSPDTETYTGETVYARVPYVTSWMQREDYVVMSIVRCDRAEALAATAGGTL